MENKLDLNYFLNENIQISLTNLFINLTVTFILSFFIRYLYIKYSPSLSNKKDFANNFFILGIATCLIITIVKNSIALSLGLVGALSIVRFRAAIKEPSELVYLFLIIAIGIGCGSGQIKITILGITFSAIAILISTNFLRIKDNTGKKSYNFLITLENGNLNSINLTVLTEKLSKITKNYEFVSMYKNSSELILSYNIFVIDSKDFDKISKEIDSSFDKPQLTITKNEFLPS
tara:strand:- start:997 stop:1695 length:699 start_codon:yes stop_codon:yes gene_type:complete